MNSYNQNPDRQGGDKPLPSTKKPVSQSKLDANRANALKSTGPRTPEGKARSSRNALTHGLTSRDLTALGEDLQLLPSIIESFTASWNPQTPYEASLVRHLAELQLRRDRCARIETGLLDPNIGSITSEHTKPTINSAIARAFASSEDSFMNLSRYEAALSRDFDRTQKQLIAARKEKLSPTPAVDKTNPTVIENKEPEPAPSIRTGLHIPPPEPEPPQIGLIWLDDDGNELEFSRRDRERREARRRERSKFYDILDGEDKPQA